VKRLFLFTFIAAAGVVAAQQPPPQDQKKTPPPTKAAEKPTEKPTEEDPPEEDEALKPEQFTLNPLEADRNVNTGNYYFKKGNYHAAAARYLRATKFNPGLAEAFLRLGETEEKLKDRKAAREAYTQYLTLAPDAKNAAEIKKKLAGWPRPK
jgi:tetratricopeptide (TPR) repeat protein